MVTEMGSSRKGSMGLTHLHFPRPIVISNRSEKSHTIRSVQGTVFRCSV